MSEKDAIAITKMTSTITTSLTEFYPIACKFTRKDVGDHISDTTQKVFAIFCAMVNIHCLQFKPLTRHLGSPSLPRLKTNKEFTIQTYIETVAAPLSTVNQDSRHISELSELVFREVPVVKTNDRDGIHLAFLDSLLDWVRPDIPRCLYVAPYVMAASQFRQIRNDNHDFGNGRTFAAETPRWRLFKRAEAWIVDQIMDFVEKIRESKEMQNVHRFIRLESEIMTAITMMDTEDEKQMRSQPVVSHQPVVSLGLKNSIHNFESSDRVSSILSGDGHATGQELNDTVVLSNDTSPDRRTIFDYLTDVTVNFASKPKR